MSDEATRRAVSQIPLLKTPAGPRDRALWPQRLKEEYQALIRFVEQNKAADNDWFRLESNADGTRWTGTCWFIHELMRYEFRLEFDTPGDVSRHRARGGGYRSWTGRRRRCTGAGGSASPTTSRRSGPGTRRASGSRTSWRWDSDRGSRWKYRI